MKILFSCSGHTLFPWIFPTNSYEESPLATIFFIKQHPFFLSFLFLITKRIDLEINHCRLTPCLNGGTCSASYGANFSPIVTCVCLPGYSGSRCERKSFTHFNKSIGFFGIVYREKMCKILKS